MAEAPHGTAPAPQGKDLANPMAMLLACAAVLHFAGLRGPEAGRLARDLEAVLGPARRGSARRTSRGTRRPASHDKFVDRVRSKIDVWSSLGSTVWPARWLRRAGGASARRRRLRRRAPPAPAGAGAPCCVALGQALQPQNQQPTGQDRQQVQAQVWRASRGNMSQSEYAAATAVLAAAGIVVTEMSTQIGAPDSTSSREHPRRGPGTGRSPTA